MLYAAFTFWLLVIVFCAWGVHTLWSGLIKPRAVNTILLPGTLVAQLGHVLGLLVTGNQVQNTALMSDDEDGEPQTEGPDKQKLPIFGAVVVGLLPLIACGAGLYAAAHFWGGSVVSRAVTDGGVTLPRELPLTVAGAWDLLRVAISSSEHMLQSVLDSNWSNWTTALFIYLAICLTVRMTPFEGNRRGALAAIGLGGGLVWLLGIASPSVAGFVNDTWPLLSFAAGMLLCLLVLSLVTVGLVHLVRTLVKDG